ncbi:conjugative transposon protein TraM [Pedobacter nutrimenti]|uniref:conjugative transposon protein TraM n=1 Tax=Pedobacter nutrimenti TaxID=1241337 RepID=UPI00292F8AC5|nr:conjugative transposon protein TraM [Pedobacter nutrimenti]
MENPAKNSKKEKKRRFLTVLPLLIVPFLTMIFWSLGGGKVESAGASTGTKTGFNNILPDAHLKEDKDLDKMSYYEQAGKDSAQLRAQLKSDPYYQQSNGAVAAAPGPGPLPAPYTPSGSGGLNTTPYNGSGYIDPNEAKVYQKLQQLNQAINQNGDAVLPGQKATPDLDGSAVQKLEKMMQQMQSGNGQQDPETAQLNDMLERVLDIQHPERVQEKLRKTSIERRNQVFAVTTAKNKEGISFLDSKAGNLGNGDTGFYSIGEVADTNEQNTIDAVVHETQTLVSGSTVKLRLLSDVFINGKLIPKDNFVFGTVTLTGERLLIKVTGIKYKKSIYPVDLAVMDIDAMEGIYIPGAIARDVAKESTDRAIQDLSFGSMSNSVGVQAAGAGVEAAKTFFSKKVKLIKVTVKAGYKVLLRDEKQKMENQ